MNTLSIHWPLPSIEIRIEWCFSTSVQAELVNWLPWSPLSSLAGFLEAVPSCGPPPCVSE